MRVLKPNPWLAGLGALLGLMISAQVTSADVTTDQSASILVFPKVIADGTRDTLIQISNTSNSLVFMHCVYLDASPLIPGLPPDPITNPRLWVARDFGPLRLTKQQPTIWRVSTGRLLDISDEPGYCKNIPDPNVPEVTRQSCPGFDPFNVPNVAVGTPGTPEFIGFEGELKCIQVDDSGTPVNGNALKGEAVIEGENGNISEYNALGIVGINVNSDAVLNLDNIEYNACPSRLILQHFATNAEDPVASGATVETEITVVPCTEALEEGEPTTVPLSVFVVDELEVRQSAPITMDCWLNQTLDYNTVFQSSVRQSTVLKTEIFGPSSNFQGVLAVAEEFRVLNGTRTGSAASNLHAVGSRTLDQITLQAGGVCLSGPFQGKTCFSDLDCTDNPENPQFQCG